MALLDPGCPRAVHCALCRQLQTPHISPELEIIPSLTTTSMVITCLIRTGEIIDHCIQQQLDSSILQCGSNQHLNRHENELPRTCMLLTGENVRRTTLRRMAAFSTSLGGCCSLRKYSAISSSTCMKRSNHVANISGTFFQHWPAAPRAPFASMLSQQACVLAQVHGARRCCQ